MSAQPMTVTLILETTRDNAGVSLRLRTAGEARTLLCQPIALDEVLAAMAALDSADDARMSDRVVRHPRKTNVADFYLRTVLHANSHVRQIWLLRGLLGLGDPKSWPQQHWS